MIIQFSTNSRGFYYSYRLFSLSLTEYYLFFCCRRYSARLVVLLIVSHLEILLMYRIEPLTSSSFFLLSHLSCSSSTVVLYVTFSASFTHFHQDGHGTVDSGHTCLSGYNEVVMLRRMPEEHKERALYILNDQKNKKKRSKYDGLYGLPHGDGLGDKPDWPTVDAIEECRRMNYYPSVFVLKSGQFVHINKGRLHAFRKLSPTDLPPNDCHRQLRLDINDDLGPKEHICISVAWDWMVRATWMYMTV